MDTLEVQLGMGTLKGEPLTKVTLFLYTSDLEALKRREGYGWSTKIRELIRQHLKKQDKQLSGYATRDGATET